MDDAAPAPSPAAPAGWRVIRLPRCPSTNDAAVERVARDPRPRQVIVADAQSAGRGREGRPFASPPGGLYASLILRVPPEDIPGPTVALVAVAAAEAIEAVVDVPVAIKWPNDLWIDGRKVGGILLELAGPIGTVIAGIGINVQRVPEDLPAEVRAQTGSLSEAAGREVARDHVLRALLSSIDRLQARRELPEGAAAIAAAWRGRLALIGEAVTCRHAGVEVHGVLEDVSLEAGLLIRDAHSGPVWRQAEHVQDLRRAARTI
jgi:BirA family biotin operon repressor/biotin-[acetyl-CoA-carboxylase] ligase